MADAAPWAFVNSDIDTADKSFSAFSRAHYPATYKIFVASCVIAVAGILFITIFHAVAALAGFEFVGFILSFVAMAYVLVFALVVNQKIGVDFGQHFATIMGYSFANDAPTSSVAGDMFQVGHSSQIADVIFGTYQNHPLRIFGYTFITGYGKYQQSHSYTVMELTFSHLVPAMSITPISGSFAQFVSNDKAIDAHSSLPMKITLEGDFGKYFSVYAPANTQVEDLEVMSPEFMQFLIDHNDVYKDSGFECHDTRLYIHLPGGLNSQRIKNFSAMYSLADVLIPKLDRIS